MRKFSSRAVLFVLAVTLLAGCGQVNTLKAKMRFKDANALYQGENYEEAAAKYEEVLVLAPDDPRFSTAYFFLANSYDQLYRPARKGEPDNDAYLTKAIENYKQSVDREQDALWKQRAQQYLVALYKDKLEDPLQAIPVLQNLIQMDPTDPSNYYVLADIYEGNGQYDLAEQTLLKARDMKSDDPGVYMQLAGFYERQGNFDKQMEALYARVDHEPNNPQAYHTVATYYWKAASADGASKAEKLEYIEKGLAAEEKALALKDDYFEALTYKGLLLRVQANVETNRARQLALIAEAEELQKRAQALADQQNAG